MHRRLADDVVGCAGPVSTLELGAGNLNQLAFEPECGPYDIVEPFAALFRDEPGLARIRHVYADIREVPAQARYARITSSAVLEHLCELPDVVARCCTLLEPHGSFRASVPSEGTWLWWLAWRLGTGLEFRLRHGLDYGGLMRHEHVNTAREIEQVLRHFFADVGIRVFGVSRSISLFQHFRCGGPRLQRAQDWLARRGND